MKRKQKVVKKVKRNEKKVEVFGDFRDHPDYDPAIPDSKQRHITR